MKFIVLFSCILLGILCSCKKETQYRSTTVRDTIITPNPIVKQDTLIIQDTLTPDTVVYHKNTVIRKSKK